MNNIIRKPEFWVSRKAFNLICAFALIGLVTVIMLLFSPAPSKAVEVTATIEKPIPVLQSPGAYPTINYTYLQNTESGLKLQPAKNIQ